MAFTYDIETNIGKVRLLIGDTDSTDVLLQDDEIDLFINTYGTIQLAASNAAMAIAAKFSRNADKQIGSLRLSFSSRAQNYRNMAKEIKQYSSSMLRGYVGGVSKSDNTVNLNNSDRVSPSFRRHSMDNIGGDNNG